MPGVCVCVCALGQFALISPSSVCLCCCLTSTLLDIICQSFGARSVFTLRLITVRHNFDLGPVTFTLASSGISIYKPGLSTFTFHFNYPRPLRDRLPHTNTVALSPAIIIIVVGSSFPFGTASPTFCPTFRPPNTTTTTCLVDTVHTTCLACFPKLDQERESRFPRKLVLSQIN